MSFVCLPNELFLEISSFQSLADQNSLFRTNKHLYRFLQHIQISTVLRTRNSAQGRRALYAFASRRDTATVRFLLDRGIISFTGTPSSILSTAIRTQTETTLRTLLDCGISARVVDNEGPIPLVTAVVDRNVGMLRILLSKEKYGVDVNAFVVRGDTPLIWAASYGHTEVVRALLEHPGINVNESGLDGYSALRVALDFRHQSALKLLLEDPRVDISATNGYSVTPLTNAVLGGAPDVVRWILENPKLDIHTPNPDGKTPLHRAAFQKDATILKILLLDGRLDVNAKCPAGHTPLHMACANSEESVRALLRDSRTDVNAKNQRGSTPLHSAAASGSEAVISTLLEDPRVDDSLKDSRGDTPLARAMFWRSGSHAVEFLQKELDKRSRIGKKPAV